MVNPGISPYSQAYHLRTPEIAPPDATGLGDSWYMDSIFVPEEHVLVRLELGNGSLEGKTKNYSSKAEPCQVKPFETNSQATSHD